MYQETWFISWKDPDRYKDERKRSETEFMMTVNKNKFGKYYVKLVQQKKLNLIHVTNFLKMYCTRTSKNLDNCIKALTAGGIDMVLSLFCIDCLG